jgi:hypothetical protein
MLREPAACLMQHSGCFHKVLNGRQCCVKKESPGVVRCWLGLEHKGASHLCHYEQSDSSSSGSSAKQQQQ